MCDGAICNGTNNHLDMIFGPCPECGPQSYLGVNILTLERFTSDWYAAEFECKNCGAYWSNDDEYYYTPDCPRL